MGETPCTPAETAPDRTLNESHPFSWVRLEALPDTSDNNAYDPQ